jgi:CRP-like cAMP-binding protein
MASGVRASGITVAVTQCRLYHLSFAKLEEIEKEDPALVLRLYKLMTHLRAHREEATIEQLSTLSNIMSSPAHSKPISRAARHALSPYR